jgi:hypothetical protein
MVEPLLSDEAVAHLLCPQFQAWGYAAYSPYGLVTTKAVPLLGSKDYDIHIPWEHIHDAHEMYCFLLKYIRFINLRTEEDISRVFAKLHSTGVLQWLLQNLPDYAQMHDPVNSRRATEMEIPWKV